MSIFYSTVETETTQETPASVYWMNVITKDWNYWFKQFKKIARMNLNGIIYNTNLTLPQKLERIFGSKWQDLFNNPTVKGLIGDLFSDIGSWFNSTFSSSNLSQWEGQLRQGSTVTNNIANMLNYFRNQPNLEQQVQQQQNIQDVQSQIISKGTGFFETYKIPIFGALALGLVYMVGKKK